MTTTLTKDKGLNFNSIRAFFDKAMISWFIVVQVHPEKWVNESSPVLHLKVHLYQ